MNDWKLRREAIAWAQREANRQLGVAQVSGEEEEVILLGGILEGLTAEMREAEQTEMLKGMLRKMVAF